jgi:hypothetical protein
LHGQTAGVYGGLSIILNAELEDYNVTSSDIVGFRVSIQSPDDFARTGKIGFMVKKVKTCTFCIYKLHDRYDVKHLDLIFL